MNLEDLRTFVEVADSGGVASGARRLGLPKSIVSRSLSRLEKSLGAQLISRTTRGSTLTEIGATFREYAVKIILELDAADEAISPEGEVRGTLRIAAPLSFGVTQLAPVFAELARRHPKLKIDTSYSDRFVDLINEGFDCAVRMGLLPDSSMIARCICPFKGYMVATPDYLDRHGVPLTLDDLAEHEAVIKKGDSWPIKDLKSGKIIRVRPQGRLCADNGEAVLAGALAGVGIAVLPDFMIEKYMASGELVPVLNDFPIPELGMFVLRPPGTAATRKVRALIDILIEKFGDESSCKKPKK